MKTKDQGTWWVICCNSHKERVPGHQQEAESKSTRVRMWAEQRVSHHTRRACWRRCSPAIALIAYLWRRRQTNMSTAPLRSDNRLSASGLHSSAGGWGSWRRGRWGGKLRDIRPFRKLLRDLIICCSWCQSPTFGKSQVRFSIRKFINSASNK